MANIVEYTQNVLNNLANNKFIKFYYTLDTQIQKNFRFEELPTRLVNSNGLWCFTLIPAILLSHTLIYEVSPVYKLIAFLSIGLLAYSVLFILFLYMSCLILKGSYTSGCTVSIFSSIIPIYCFLGYDLIISLFYSAIVVGSYSVILKMTLLNCPKTFTIGEAMVVSQGFSLFLTTCTLTVYSKKVFPEVEDDEEMRLIKTYVITVLSTVGLLVTALYNLKNEDRTCRVLFGLLISAAAVAVIPLYVSLGPQCMANFFNYVFRDKLRTRLFLFWLWLLVAAALVVAYRVEIGVKVTSATRKSFHILAALVFASGILLDTHFIMLASGILFGVIIFIEALRLSGIQPISSALQNAFNVYSDEKDVGVFAMTPIYLFAGLACPLLLVPWAPGRRLELLGGVLSVGVGDSAASWVGERYGSVKWLGTNRTLEGTIAYIASQIVTVYILNLFELLQSPHSLVRAGVAGALTALCEARLEQVDNLVLPLLTLLALNLTAWLPQTL